MINPLENKLITPTSMSLEKIQEQRQLLDIEQGIAINRAFVSNDAMEILKAQTFLQNWDKKKASVSETKSILVDPYSLSSSTGYRQTPQKISFQSLRNMSRVPIIRAIIETRKDQVSAFCDYTEDEYTTGFKIQKKSKKKAGQRDVITKQDQNTIDELSEFVLNCGNTQDKWYGDTFDSFLRKFVDDGLTIDQATFEVVQNRKGLPSQIIVTDGATYRVADTYNEPITRENRHLSVNGYLPSHVQVIDGQVQNYFYPWELCFGVRNPQTNIMKAGYGRSELEDLVDTVISLVNADQYNSNFFKVGSNPRGIIRYSGNINSTTLQDLKENWNAQVAGVNNMHKTPVINADKVDWINTHQTNRDMEYSVFQEFLIKITCALYKIDPSEIGFNLSGSGGVQPMFEGNNEARLKYSKDKGLKPLLKQIQFWINKFWIAPQAPDYEFVFVGLDGGTKESELDTDIKRVNSFLTLNELREKQNLPPLKNGDVPMNPTYTNYIQALASQEQQQKMQEQQQEMQEQQMNQEQAQQDEDRYSEGGSSEDEYSDEENSDEYSDAPIEEENPIVKAFGGYFNQLISKN